MQSSGTLDIQTTVERGEARLSLEGELDITSAPQLEEELGRLESGGEVQTVVLDLRGLTFIDSSGLRAVLQTEARYRSNGIALELIPGPEEVQRVFELTRTASRLAFRSSD